MPTVHGRQSAGHTRFGLRQTVGGSGAAWNSGRGPNWLATTVRLSERRSGRRFSRIAGGRLLRLEQ
jgi:hypothetical protein